MRFILLLLLLLPAFMGAQVPLEKMFGEYELKDIRYEETFELIIGEQISVHGPGVDFCLPWEHLSDPAKRGSYSMEYNLQCIDLITNDTFDVYFGFWKGMLEYAWIDYPRTEIEVFGELFWKENKDNSWWNPYDSHV